MATFERHADVSWKGSVTEGKGEAKAGTGAFTLPVTFAARIGEPGRKTSPEELMAAVQSSKLEVTAYGLKGNSRSSHARPKGGAPSRTRTAARCRSRSTRKWDEQIQ